jgi:hypothetical protein
MRTISFAAFLLVFQLLTTAARADDIKEADYPVHYEVLDTAKTDNLVIQKSCTMALRDQAHASITINVSRKRIGSCDVLPSGKVYNGRQNGEKNEIELVIPVGENKAKIEIWRIDATLKNPE